MYEYHKDGVDAFNEKRYAKAIDLLSQAILKKRVNPDSYYFLGQAFFMMGNRGATITYLEEYKQFSSELPEKTESLSSACVLLAKCYEALRGSPNRIKEQYKIATRLNPTNCEAWYRWGLFYLRLAPSFMDRNNDKSARLLSRTISHLKKALDLGIIHLKSEYHLARAYKLYGTVLHKLNQAGEATSELQKKVDNCYELARHYYEKALHSCTTEGHELLKSKITAEYIECLSNCGHYFFERHDYEKAKNHASRSLDLDYDHLASIKLYGLCCHLQQQYEEARTYFYYIFEVSTDGQEHINAWIKIACTYQSEGNWDELEKILQKIKPLAPDNPVLISIEGQLQVERRFNTSALAITLQPSIWATPTNQDSPPRDTMTLTR